MKACIFDLDGTLLYTLDSMEKAGSRVLKDLGLTPLPVENYRYYCGEGAEMLVRRILTDAGDKELEHLDEACALYRRYFSEDPLFQVDPYPEVEALLTILKNRGMKLAVCSNKPHEATQAVIENKFPGVFDAVIGQQPGIERKPAPDTALLAARQMNVEPQDCLYIGDSGTDMKTGKAAGMYTLGVLWGYRDLEELEENGADDSVFSPMDILTLLDRNRF